MLFRSIILLFVPGGAKRILALLLIVGTAFLGLFFMHKRRKQVVEEYNRFYEKYQMLLAEKEVADQHISGLEQEISTLRTASQEGTARMEEYYRQYLEAKQEAARREAERSRLDEEIQEQIEKVDGFNYEGGTAARLRQRLEALKEKATTPAPQPVAQPARPPVADPSTVAGNALAIDIQVDGFRLKGDIR